MRSDSMTIYTVDDHCEDIVVHYKYHFAEFGDGVTEPITRDFEVYSIEATYTDGSEVPPENLEMRDLENILWEKLI